MVVTLMNPLFIPLQGRGALLRDCHLLPPYPLPFPLSPIPMRGGKGGRAT